LLAPRNESLTGRLLDGRYRVGERIARGGMASVYLGTDERLDRVVAVKVMHPGLADDSDFTSRFEREARSAAKLNHPNVVAVFDQGEDQGFVFLVMEYVPGRTLRDVMRAEAPMPADHALAFLEPLLVALSAAHDAGIVHRDVKPENVLIAPDGRIKVADFGLARAVSSSTTATATTGVLIGTISYLAPELVVNEGADARSDVYACGAMLYEMLTGDKPHPGESPIQVAYKHVHEDIAAPSKAVPGIPPYIDALVARATARDRDLRSADARVLLTQVRQARSALADGLADDVELTQDLRPRRGDTLPLGAEAVDVYDDTADAFPDAVAPLLDPREAPYDESTVVVTHSSAGRAEIPPPGLDDYDDYAHVPSTQRLPAAAARVPPVPRAAAPTSRAAVSRPAPSSTAATAYPTGGLAPMSREQYASARGPRRNRRGSMLLILVIILAVLIAVGSWYYGVARYDSTPSLVGMNAAAAATKATEAGFTLEPTYDFNEDIPKGEVMATDPSPGERILPDDTITALVSKGKERYEVPPLAGLTLDEAQRKLTAVNLVLGDVERRFSEKIPSDEIIKGAVSPKTSVKRDTAVDVILSKGRQPLDIVDTTGTDAAAAVTALEDAGFDVTSSQAYASDVAEGVVISQSPSSGTGYKGDEIALSVSKGAKPVGIPNVVGRQADDAKAVLEDAGFEVKVADESPYIDVGLVVRQDPPRGTKVQPGETITIFVV